MQIQINGQTLSIEDESLFPILQKHGIEISTPGVAVAVNGEIIPRSFWEERVIKERDKIEIIYAVQGG